MKTIETYYEEAKRLMDNLKSDGKHVEMTVLSRKVDREGLIAPDRVLLSYE